MCVVAINEFQLEKSVHPLKKGLSSAVVKIASIIAASTSLEESNCESLLDLFTL